IPSRSPAKPNHGSDLGRNNEVNAPGPQERETPHLNPKP
ncbi:hypothetical protein A2U01_0065236, partial [Trifolium medium]|nr:hypothetical protein [Trifolium medium]